MNSGKESRRSCALIAALSLALAAPSGALAQAGFPNAARTPGELLTPGPQGFSSDGRGAIIAFHGGLLYTVPEHPSSAPGSSLHIKIWDISTEERLTNPLLVENLGVGPMNMQAHGYVLHDDALQLGGDQWLFRRTGYQQYQRMSWPTTAPQGLQNIVWERGRVVPRWVVGHRPTGGNIGGNWFYNLDQHRFALGRRTQANSHNATEIWADWDHLAVSGGVMGMPFIFGDLLIIASEEQTLSGVAVYDLKPTFHSQGTPPTLLGVFREGAAGGYWPELWGQGDKLYLFQPRRNSGVQGWQIVDLSDPSDIQLVADVALNTTWRDSLMYVQFQDNFAFSGRYKIDMLNPHTPALTLPVDAGGGVWRDTSQFALPLGNLLVTGGLGSMDEQAWRIWAHQAAPDTQGPTVGYHRPRPNQTHWPRNAPLAFLIHETLRIETVINGETVILRPLGGSPVDALINFSSGNQLNVVPLADLAADTEYEVEFPAGGILDAAGNGIEAYSFRFSTGGSASGNLPPEITAFDAGPYPVAPGASMSASASATDPDPGDTVEFRFIFGDGNSSAWGASSNATHSYASPGRYTVQVQARDNHGAISSRATKVTVMTAPAGPFPTQSSSIAHHAASDTLWIANPDHHTVSRVHRPSMARTGEFGVGTDPRSVAIDAQGRIWVACHDDDRIDILDTNGATLDSINTGYGSAPVAIAMAPGGAVAYVSLTGSGELLRVDSATLATATLALGPTPRAIAVSGNGQRVLVTRFISARNHGEVYDVNAGTFTLTRRIRLPMRMISSDTSADSRGVPNYLSGIAITPDGQRAWVTAKKDNITRGLQFFDGRHELGPDSTVRAQFVVINLSSNSVDETRGRDIDNSDSPSAIAFSALGDYAFITLQGNNEVAVFDALRIATAPGQQGIAGRWAVGHAPQGVVFMPDSNEIATMDFMQRGLSAFQLSTFLTTGSGAGAPAQVALTAGEALPPSVFSGKRIFYNAADPRMSPEGYISCATCHIDGGSDGRVWDFSGRGEGLRNSIDLRGRAGMGHGLVHWTANFDEIQDFENDIRLFFGGSGFMSDADFAATQDPLGAPKAGLSEALDDLAAYVTSLGAATLPKSPYRQADGSMTEAALRGQTVFSAEGCGSCHAPALQYRDGLRHDVGTLRVTSGQRIGGPLDGIDTPTLIGLWDNPPFFHDGSAATLTEVFEVAGGPDYQAEDGTASAGAQVQMQYIDLNDGNATFGGYVNFPAAGAQLALSGIQGGSGGMTRVELRYSYPANAGGFGLAVNVNGQVQNLSLPALGSWGDWRTVGIQGFTLNAGSTNSLTLTATSGGWPPLRIDQVLVSRPSDLALAEPHRRVAALSAGDQNDLIAYLRELDGRPAGGIPPPPEGFIFANGFEGP